MSGVDAELVNAVGGMAVDVENNEVRTWIVNPRAKKYIMTTDRQPTDLSYWKTSNGDMRLRLCNGHPIWFVFGSIVGFLYSRWGYGMKRQVLSYWRAALGKGEHNARGIIRLVTPNQM